MLVCQLCHHGSDSVNLLLDTTIQIDRFLGSKERKLAINKVLLNNKLFSSTYVLGEYYNLINDFITLYALFIQDKNIAETGKHITERTFGRSRGRIEKLYFNIIEKCDYDIDLIENTLDNFLCQIESVFTYRLELPLIDCTRCARAQQKIICEDEIPMLKKVKCHKDKEICQICVFFEQRAEELEKLLKVEIAQNFREIISKGIEQISEFRGNNCKSVGDVIISLEANELESDKGVCSSNKRDFKPVCECLEIPLISPDYSFT